MNDDDVVALLGDDCAKIYKALMYLAKHDRAAYRIVRAELWRMLDEEQSQVTVVTDRLAVPRTISANGG